jgi:membrane-bound ClpP family serine protease
MSEEWTLTFAFLGGVGVAMIIIGLIILDKLHQEKRYKHK